MQEEVTVDWAVLEIPTVNEVIDQAVRKAVRKYPDVAEADDLTQEARIWMATRPSLRQAAYEQQWGFLQHGLEQDCDNWLLPRAKKAAETLSYDALVAEAETDTYALPYVVIETASNDYTRESVESLLPAVWDESYLYGLPQRDDAPDPDMPRGSTNKARGNNLSAYIADIKTGWEKTPLTLKERRALFLAYAANWSQVEIANHEGVTKQTIQERIEIGVGKITARLNGGYWHELEQQQEDAA